MQVAQYANPLLIPRWLTVRIIRDLLLLLLLLFCCCCCGGGAGAVPSLFLFLFLFFSLSFLPFSIPFPSLKCFPASAFYPASSVLGDSVGEHVRVWQGRCKSDHLLTVVINWFFSPITQGCQSTGPTPEISVLCYKMHASENTGAAEPPLELQQTLGALLPPL